MDVLPLKETHKILGANGNYYINEHWSSMNAVEFFGNPTYFKLNNQRKRSKQNLRNAYAFTNGWWLRSETTAVYCHDASLPDKDNVNWSQACSSSNYPDPIIVAPHYNGNNKPALML